MSVVNLPNVQIQGLNCSQQTNVREQDKHGRVRTNVVHLTGTLCTLFSTQVAPKARFSVRTSPLQEQATRKFPLPIIVHHRSHHLASTACHAHTVITSLADLP